MNGSRLYRFYTIIAAGIVLRGNGNKESTSNLLALLKINKDFIEGAVLITLLYILNWYVVYPLIVHR